MGETQLDNFPGLSITLRAKSSNAPDSKVYLMTSVSKIFSTSSSQASLPGWHVQAVLAVLAGEDVLTTDIKTDVLFPHM